MQTYIALIRGINVGSNRRLPMKALEQLLCEHGCLDVRTYIQSGNAVFRCASSDAAALASRLAAAVGRTHGFEPRVLLLTRSALARAAAGNPFPEADANPQRVHLFFLAERPKKADLPSLDALKTKTERFLLKDKVFYLHTPDGFGISRLAERAERLLGVDATARNWRTVTALLEMSGSLPDRRPPRARALS
jgi:uncharacterized protein (DUF1697 family)